MKEGLKRIVLVGRSDLVALTLPTTLPMAVLFGSDKLPPALCVVALAAWLVFLLCAAMIHYLVPRPRRSRPLNPCAYLREGAAKGRRSSCEAQAVKETASRRRA